ncbi:TrkA-related ion transporter [Bacillus coahuilensis]|nr:NAD-binding protein [Bacillus coahuilensis]
MYLKKNHYVYIGWSKKTEQAIHEVFAHDSHAEIVLIDELPESPVSHSQVHFIQGDPSDEEILEKANLFYAKRVAIFSDTKIDQTLLADGKTLLIASAVEAMCKEGGKNIHTIVEICEERNIPKFKHINIDDFVLSNDGVSLLMAKATLHPGSTALFRQLLSKRTGDNIHELKPAPNWKTYRDASQAIFEQGGSLLAVNDQMDFTNASTQLLKETDTLYIVCKDETYLRVIRETGASPSD